MYLRIICMLLFFAVSLSGFTWTGEMYFDCNIVYAENAETYFNRGMSYFKLGDYDKAISEFIEAIKINPRYIEAYYNRGEAWLKKRDYSRAIVDFNRVIEVEPRNKMAYYNRGRAWNNSADAWYKEENYDKSIDGCNNALIDFTKALEIEPNPSLDVQLQKLQVLMKNKIEATNGVKKADQILKKAEEMERERRRR
ncbi:tetratricopeptide repeat protein [Candidatus Magnetobacterium casense]|uniref:Tetratricopeptide repeat protein n=1 Tax=Candidatus Magnetobacterium casense TaxID=1455061 RepID=A0ABS6RUZ0_9BACT|nr:tetratricopeptide repeat protein [Candidatus Magnetobacterium casensis]MBV6340165.1 tetratricopeptide repeat protein [Candidatus Magnetobacterium casensis]